jgi:hypothetical protein
VWKEAARKELKIASSQGCSRILEKLILAAGGSGLKVLWKAFSGQYELFFSLPPGKKESRLLIFGDGLGAVFYTWYNTASHRTAARCCSRGR